MPSLRRHVRVPARPRRSFFSVPPMPTRSRRANGASHRSVSSVPGMPTRSFAPTLRSVLIASRLRVPASASLAPIPKDGGDLSRSSNATSRMPPPARRMASRTRSPQQLDPQHPPVPLAWSSPAKASASSASVRAPAAPRRRATVRAPQRSRRPSHVSSAPRKHIVLRAILRHPLTVCASQPFHSSQAYTHSADRVYCTHPNAARCDSCCDLSASRLAPHTRAPATMATARASHASSMSIDDPLLEAAQGDEAVDASQLLDVPATRLGPLARRPQTHCAR